MGAEHFILAVDTASPRGGVCLMQGDNVLGSIISEPSVSHSNILLRDIQAVLDVANISLSAIDVFATASGPGSFTGLRIGLATIKALSATLGRPCVGVPTLQAVARAAGPSAATVALLPAGRGELFAQLLSVSSPGLVSEQDSPVHLPVLAIIERYSQIRELTWAEPELKRTGIYSWRKRASTTLVLKAVMIPTGGSLPSQTIISHLR